MTLVLDASVTVAWLLDEEVTDSLRAIFDRVARERAVVPALWRLEVANALQMAVRRGRIAKELRDIALADLRAYPIAIDEQTDALAWTSIVVLSDRHLLTTYDAAYLELAVRQQISLATLDRELRAAAAIEGVDLLG